MCFFLIHGNNFLSSRVSLRVSELSKNEVLIESQCNYNFDVLRICSFVTIAKKPVHRLHWVLWNFWDTSEVASGKLQFSVPQKPKWFSVVNSLYFTFVSKIIEDILIYIMEISMPIINTFALDILFYHSVIHCSLFSNYNSIYSH